MGWQAVWQRPSSVHPWAMAGWLWPYNQDLSSVNCDVLRSVGEGERGWCGSQPYASVTPRTVFPVGPKKYYQVWVYPDVWDQWGKRLPARFAGWLWSDARGASAVRDTAQRVKPGAVVVV